VVRDTPSKDLVITILKQVWVIPNKEFHKEKKSVAIILSPILKNPTRYWVVNNISKPKVRVDYKQLLMRKAFRYVGLKLSIADNPRQMISN